MRDWVDGYGVAGPAGLHRRVRAADRRAVPGPAAGRRLRPAVRHRGWGRRSSIVAATLGAALAFSLARWIAHDAVEQLQGARLAALRAWVGRRGFLSILYARIVPGVPYSLVNYAAGLSPVALRTFAAATALGCAPRAFAYTALGGSLGDLGSPEAIAAVVVLVVMAVVGLAWRRRELRRACGRCANDRATASTS